MGTGSATSCARGWRLGFSATGASADVGSLRAEERALVADALPARRAAFATGRWCAHAALRQVTGAAGRPLLRDEAGAPLWPSGVVGSITHTPGWTGAVVSRAGWRRGVRSVGLDAEATTALPPGVLDVVASPRERDDLERLAALNGSTPWDTVLFTAKEATYKAWYPLSGVVLPHDAVEVALSADGTFTAVARASTVATSSRTVHVRGRWARGPRAVVSLGVVD